MMKVVEFLKQHGLEKLKSEFDIVVSDYEDRVVLNYSQLSSPRFHPICDECRGLILSKDAWEVMCRPFDRFYNLGEGIPEKKDGVVMHRLAAEGVEVRPFDMSLAIFQEKLDGSILNRYFDGESWCVSTRKMAFAEGCTELGRSFAEIFNGVADKFELDKQMSHDKNCTFSFELTGPENRVVTPYTEADITLIGGRRNDTGDEIPTYVLDELAEAWGINRPNRYTVADLEELISKVEGMPAMEEGMVALIETDHGSFIRLKVKNSKFVAIHHMRDNGNLSLKRVLKLVMENEHHEYLKYFPEDVRFFTFMEDMLADLTLRLEKVYGEISGIEDQKEYALEVKARVQYSIESGLLFSTRKTGTPVSELLLGLEPKVIVKSLDLKARFLSEFDSTCED